MASPLLAASPEAAGVAPSVGVGCAGVEAGAVDDVGFAPPRPPKRPVVAPDVGAAAEEAGVAELVAAPLVAVVVAPLAGVELVGVLTSGFLKRPKAELPPAAGALGVEAPAVPKRLEVVVAEEVAALSLSPPPKLKPPNEGVADGCEAAGCEAGVDPPRLNEGGLLAGVVLGRPPPPPNSPPAGLGVSCELEVAAGVAPPNSPAGVGGVALLFASFEPAAPPKRPVVGVETPAGLAPNKLDVVPDAGAAAGFAAPPNKPDPDVLPLA